MKESNPTWCPYRKKTPCKDRDTERECHEIVEGKIGLIQLQAKELQGLTLPEASKRQGRMLSRVSEGL